MVIGDETNAGSQHEFDASASLQLIAQQHSWLSGFFEGRPVIDHDAVDMEEQVSRLAQDIYVLVRHDAVHGHTGAGSGAEPWPEFDIASEFPYGRLDELADHVHAQDKKGGPRGNKRELEGRMEVLIGFLVGLLTRRSMLAPGTDALDRLRHPSRLVAAEVLLHLSILVPDRISNVVYPEWLQEDHGAVTATGAAVADLGAAVSAMAAGANPPASSGGDGGGDFPGWPQAWAEARAWARDTHGSWEPPVQCPKGTYTPSGKFLKEMFDKHERMMSTGTGKHVNFTRQLARDAAGATKFHLQNFKGMLRLFLDHADQGSKPPVFFLAGRYAALAKMLICPGVATLDEFEPAFLAAQAGSGRQAADAWLADIFDQASFLLLESPVFTHGHLPQTANRVFLYGLDVKDDLAYTSLVL